MTRLRQRKDRKGTVREWEDTSGVPQHSVPPVAPHGMVVQWEAQNL